MPGSWPTGWYRPIEGILFDSGPQGITGGWWKHLDVKVEFSTGQTVVGTKCDYDANPYKVYTSDDGVDWLEVASNLRGDHTFTEPFATKFARYRWESTLGSNGFHFQFLASPSPPPSWPPSPLQPPPSPPLAPFADEPCTNSTQEARCKVTLKIEARLLPFPRPCTLTANTCLPMLPRHMPTMCGSQRVAGVLSVQRLDVPDD